MGKINVMVKGDENFLAQKSEVIYSDENGKRLGEVSITTENDRLKVSVDVDLLEMPMEVISKIQNIVGYLQNPHVS